MTHLNQEALGSQMESAEALSDVPMDSCGGSKQCSMMTKLMNPNSWQDLIGNLALLTEFTSLSLFHLYLIVEYFL